MKKAAKKIVSALMVTGFLATGQNTVAFAAPAYKVYGKTVSEEELKKQNQSKFFRFEEEKFQLIDGMAKQAFLDAFWVKKAKEQNIAPSAAREKYMQTHIKISESELQETLKKYADHPKLKDLPKEEQKAQIRNLLHMRGEQDVMQAIIDEGLKSGELAVLFPRPQEPIVAIEVHPDDQVRFGPSAADVTPAPQGCKGSDCAITVVEYSEYQCPFCSKVIPDTKRLLTEYRGKIRWIVRDYPLSFHDRARPAAVAAHCAGLQGKNKFWEMYYTLFENQQKLSEQDFHTYAAKIKLDVAKFKQCLAQPQAVDKAIDRNLQSATLVDVSGTPAFFINGRKLSGALPYEEFKRVIDEELAKSSKATGGAAKKS